LTIILLVKVSFVIIPERLQQHDAGSVLVPEQRDGAVHALLKVAEAYDVAAVLYGIQYAVRPAVGLQQSVQLQVLVHPEGVERLCVKACQEHSYHYQYVYLLVLHPERHILVVRLE
jgi:hypothetical protein